jgi:hypothetical protein
MYMYMHMQLIYIYQYRYSARASAYARVHAIRATVGSGRYPKKRTTSTVVFKVGSRSHRSERGMQLHAYACSSSQKQSLIMNYALATS